MANIAMKKAKNAAVLIAEVDLREEGGEDVVGLREVKTAKSTGELEGMDNCESW
jgi:hypothetical protein